MDYKIKRNDEFIEHHGVKGQKHGVRRYQNEDGSLTEEGKRRYGTRQDYSKQDYRTSRKIATAPTKGAGWLQRKNAERLQRAVDNAKAHDDEEYAKKKQRRLDAQKAAQANLEAYSKRTSTGKHVVQNLLFSVSGAANYQHARARGATRIRSLLESTAGMGVIGTVLRVKGDRKSYGALTLSDIPGETL